MRDDNYAWSKSTIKPLSDEEIRKLIELVNQYDRQGADRGAEVKIFFSKAIYPIETGIRLNESADLSVIGEFNGMTIGNSEMGKGIQIWLGHSFEMPYVNFTHNMWYFVSSSDYTNSEEPRIIIILASGLKNIKDDVMIDRMARIEIFV